jgi:amino-acid N-acetyltransferase
VTPESRAQGSPEEVTLRRARPDELAEVLVLARGARLLESGIAEAFGSFVVATAGRRVVGACGLEDYGACALMRTVVVAEDFRGRGVGRDLVAAALATAAAVPFESVFLLTTDAGGFFAKLGFRPYPRASAPSPIRMSWEFRSGCPDTALLMRWTA